MGMPYNVNWNLGKNPIQLPFFPTLLVCFVLFLFFKSGFLYNLEPVLELAL